MKIDRIPKIVTDISSKTCPDEIEETCVYLYGQLLKLQDENASLRKKIENLSWHVPSFMRHEEER